MNQIIKMLLILSIVCFNGCVSKPIVLQSVCHYVQCNKPNKPVYHKLDSTKHIGEAGNVNVLLDNINLMNIYIRELELTISCYEMQVNK